MLAITANHIAPTLLATRAYFPVGASWSDITHPEHDFEARSITDRQLFTGIAARTAVRSVTPLGRYQMWHRRKAFQAMTDYLDRGEKFIQCIQGEDKRKRAGRG